MLAHYGYLQVAITYESCLMGFGITLGRCTPSLTPLPFHARHTRIFLLSSPNFFRLCMPSLPDFSEYYLRYRNLPV